jgi:hypothetical protein
VKKKEWQSQAEKAQAEANAKAAAQAKAAAEAAKEKNAAVMKELGITESEATGFDALVGMLGGSSKDVMTQYKNYAAKAQSFGYPISGFQAAPPVAQLHGRRVQSHQLGAPLRVVERGAVRLRPAGEQSDPGDAAVQGDHEARHGP